MRLVLDAEAAAGSELFADAYAATHDRHGLGPVRERYLADPLETPDVTQWRTEVCWPLARADVQAN
jgi:hypothetical protein